MSEHSVEIDAAVRRSVNGHTLELRATYWRCLQCDHCFENASDAEGFWCGDDCTGRHYGDDASVTPPAETVQCDHCHGTGARRIGPHPCPTCNGSGRVTPSGATS